MSGPKKSSYQIERERRQKLEAERRLKEQIRLEQKISEIKHRLSSYTLVKAPDIDKAKNWISEAENHIRSNNYWQADNQIRGVENYFIHLDRVEQRVKDAQIRLDQDMLKNQHNIQLNNQLEAVLLEKEIMSEGIKQRVELFSKSVKESIQSNKQTDNSIVEQIEQFLNQVEKIKNDYEQKKSEQDFVKKSLINMLDGGGESSGSILGNINGQPVKISFGDNADSKIVFNIDESKGGSCMESLNKINNNLAKNGIGLGEIIVERTGQKLNISSNNQNEQRIKS